MADTHNDAREAEETKDADGGGADLPFELRASAGLADWLGREQVSLVFATPPQKLFYVGLRPDGHLGIYERSFDKTMGLAREGTESIWLGTNHRVWRLENAEIPSGHQDEGFDRCYVPRQVVTTGVVNIHDVGVEPDGSVLFVNTRFGCLARLPSSAGGVAGGGPGLSFEVTWTPPYAPEPRPVDRCHLNGVAMGADGAEFVSSVGQSDEPGGWRHERRKGGTIVHVPSREIVVTGLSMPHSPRLHAGRLWCTNSGTGELCLLHPELGTFEPVASVPGFARGMTFHGDYAIVGTSKPREGDLYSGLALDDILAQRKQRPLLGIFVISLKRGEVEEWMLVEGPMRELYDVIALPGVRRPMALGIVTHEIHHTMFYDPDGLVRGPDGNWQPPHTPGTAPATEGVSP